jgi:hypothetical protein
VGVPGSEDDDFLDEGGQNGDDFIDADGEDVTPPAPQRAQASRAAENDDTPARDASPTAASNGSKKRRVRVKPMPASLTQRWPDVSTLLITMRDGTQVLLVR